jgi:WD40 repeat protein
VTTDRAPPYELVLELTRAEEAGDPFVFRFGEQTYLFRREGGAVETATFLWSEDTLEALAALQRPRPDPEARQRIGEAIRSFLAQASWRLYEESIARALDEGRRVHLTLRSAAAELSALPWELVTLKATGRHLGRVPGVLFRYEWPGTETAAPRPDPPPEGGRLLAAWSAAGGAVPAEAHIAAIRRACRDGRHPFDEERDVIAHVSLRRLREALTAPGAAPVSVLHILCHGSEAASASEVYGLAWDPSEGPGAAGGSGEAEIIDAGSLRDALAPYAGSLRLVVLSACHSAGSGALGNHLGSVAQALHRAGIPAVVASRYPLSTDASVTLTDALYRSLLVGLASLEDAFLAARDALGAEPGRLDWASLQLFARAKDGPDHRPFVFRPYRGLRAFAAEDRRFFFGREADVERLLQALRSGSHLLTLVGASGSGKSSLVMAGVVPAVLGGALGSAGYEARILRPGAHPVRALAASLASLFTRPEAPRVADIERALLDDPGALARTVREALGEGERGGRLLLVVDQLEELFTQRDQREAREPGGPEDPGGDRTETAAFVKNLLLATSTEAGKVLVVLTLRADFMGACIDKSRALAERIEASMKVALPMSEDKLREAIVRPAELVGLRFEDGLVEALLDALREGVVSGSPGVSGAVGTSGAADAAGAGVGAASLPLLEFALEGLWERRTERSIAWAAWRDLGGIRGAIAKRADEVLAACAGERERRLARDLFGRLVLLGQGTADTRRYATRAELESIAPGEAGPELDRWIEARLLTVDEDRIGVAHEAVIREWGTLRRWIAEDREALLVRQEIGQDAARWDAGGRSPDELWRGGRLKRATELREASKLRLSGIEAAFLEAAEAAARAEADAVEAARQRELERVKRSRRRARTVAALAILGFIVMASLGVAVYRQKEAAERAARLASARVLAARGRPAWAVAVLREVGEPEPAAAQDWVGLVLDVLHEAPPRVTLHGHEGAVHTAAWSPDGERILTASADATARIWRVDGTGDPVILKTHAEDVLAAAWSPDGERVVTACADGSARVFRAQEDSAPVVLKGHTGKVIAAAFSPDGERVATASEDGTARVFHADGSREPVVLRGHEAPLTSVAWSPDGLLIVTASEDGTARVWSPDDAHAPTVLAGHNSKVVAAAFSPDGLSVATASWDKTARIFRVDGSQPAPPSVVLQGPSAEVVSAAWSPDGRRVACASGDASIWVFAADGASEPLVLRGHDAPPLSAAFSPDGKHIVTAGGADRTARVWDSESEHGAVVLSGHDERVLGASFSPDGARVVTASEDKTARVFRAAGTGEPARLRGHAHARAAEEPARTVAWSPDARRIVATAGADVAFLWRADGQGDPALLGGHDGPLRSAAWSPDSLQIVTASHDKKARIFRVEEGRDPALVRAFDHPDKLELAAFSPDGARVVTASADGIARVWSARGDAAPVVLRGHQRPVLWAAFSPDGKLIVTASEDETARVFQADGSGDPVVLRGHQGAVTSAAFRPDGASIVTSSFDGTVRVFRADGSGAPLIFRSHEGKVTFAAFSPDGARIVSASEDRSARIWSPKDIAEPLLLRGHEGAVNGAAWSPDGKRLATASADGIVRLWDLDKSVLEERLRDATTDCLPPKLRREVLNEGPPVAVTRYTACELSAGRTPVHRFIKQLEGE